MGTKAEALRIPGTITGSTKRPRGRSIVGVVIAWYRKGQLGSATTTEQGRYTGGRV